MRRATALPAVVVAMSLAIAVAACGSGAPATPASTAAPLASAAQATQALAPSPVPTTPPTTSPSGSQPPAPSGPTTAASLPPGPITLKSGTATVQFTVGAKKASIKVPLDLTLQPRIDEDGSFDVQWDNLSGNSITEGLQLVIPNGKSGTYAVDLNHNYVTFYVEILQSDVEHVSCKVAVKRTPSGGIQGTVDCKGRLRQMLDPVTAKGTFSAEP